MEHKPIRYQAFQLIAGMDLCCKCGVRWYLRSDRRTYGAQLAQVAKHFSWEPPAIGASPVRLINWLHGNLPDNLRPKAG